MSMDERHALVNGWATYPGEQPGPGLWRMERAARRVRHAKAPVYRIRAERDWGWGLPDGGYIIRFWAEKPATGEQLTPFYIDMSEEQVFQYMLEKYPDYREVK